MQTMDLLGNENEDWEYDNNTNAYNGFTWARKRGFGNKIIAHIQTIDSLEHDNGDWE